MTEPRRPHPSQPDNRGWASVPPPPPPPPPPRIYDTDPMPDLTWIAMGGYIPATRGERRDNDASTLARGIVVGVMLAVFAAILGGS